MSGGSLYTRLTPLTVFVSSANFPERPKLAAGAFFSSSWSSSSLGGLLPPSAPCLLVSKSRPTPLPLPLPLLSSLSPSYLPRGGDLLRWRCLLSLPPAPLSSLSSLSSLSLSLSLVHRSLSSLSLYFLFFSVFLLLLSEKVCDRIE